MAKYKASQEVYLSNSKASVLFQAGEYTPRNKAEEELLQEAVKVGKVEKVIEPKKAMPVKVGKVERKL